MVGLENRRSIRADLFAAAYAPLRTTSYIDTPGPRGATPSSIRTLAWSPLGNWVATGTGDRKLRVWNPDKPAVRYSTELKGHDKAVERVAWNPLRTEELASASADGSVRVWDVRSAKAVAVVETGARRENFTLSWRPDGEEMVCGTKVGCVFGSGSERFADGLAQDNVLYKISRAMNTVVSEHKQPQQTNHLAFSWSGREIFLTCGDGTVEILDYETMERLHSFKAHTTSCFAIELSPDGRRLAVGGTDALISMWDTTTWLCKRTFARTAGPLRTLSFSWDGGYIVGGGEEERHLDIAHVESGEYLYRKDVGYSTPFVQFSPRDYTLAFVWHEDGNKGAGGLRIINAANMASKKVADGS